MKESERRMHSQAAVKALVRKAKTYGYSKAEVEALVERGEWSRSFVAFENGKPYFYTPLAEIFPDEAERQAVCRACDAEGIPVREWIERAIRAVIREARDRASRAVH